MPLKDGFLIRPAAPEDAAALHFCHRRAITVLAAPFHSAAQIAAWAEGRDPARFVWAIASGNFEVAAAEGRIAAYCLQRGAEIVSLYTDPDFARQGLATRLMDRAEARIAAEGHTIARVEAALSGVPFYRARGYVTVEEITWTAPGNVKTPQARMEKPLGPQPPVRDM